MLTTTFNHAIVYFTGIIFLRNRNTKTIFKSDIFDRHIVTPIQYNENIPYKSIYECLEHVWKFTQIMSCDKDDAYWMYLKENWKYDSETGDFEGISPSSMMVGDIVQINNEFYIVKGIGFEKLYEFNNKVDIEGLLEQINK